MPKKIAVISIEPEVTNPLGRSFDELYQWIGLNTGNMMFSRAMFANIHGEVSHIGFSFDPAKISAEYDIVLVPAANWLNATSDWSWLADRIEKMTIPVVTVGIGLQAETLDKGRVVVSESGLRLARVLSAKAAYLSTRGDFTSEWLYQQGITNAITTGCPSLFMGVVPPVQDRTGRGIVLQSTRYQMSDKFLAGTGINRALFDLSGRLGLDMVYQSEPEEMEYLTFPDKAQRIDQANAVNLPALYAQESPAALRDWLTRHGRVFYSLTDWAQYLQTKAGVAGTRLHGAILALNSGVPAFLFPHDSRTQELVTFAGIPTMDFDAFRQALEAGEAEALMAGMDFAPFHRRRGQNLATYRGFLAANGLSYKAD